MTNLSKIIDDAVDIRTFTSLKWHFVERKGKCNVRYLVRTFDRQVGGDCQQIRSLTSLKWHFVERNAEGRNPRCALLGLSH